MQTVVIPSDSPPDPVIDVPTLRARLGITSNLNDASLEAYILAATAVIDGPGGWLGRAVTQQTLELQAEFFPWCGCGWPDHEWRPFYSAYSEAIKLICPPITEIVSVSYVDGTGTPQTLDPSAYILNGQLLTPAYNTTWPPARLQPNAVQVRYTAGYPKGEVPFPIVQAIVLQVASMNSMTKADALLSSESVAGVYSRSWSPTGGSSYDQAAGALLAPYRVIT